MKREHLLLKVAHQLLSKQNKSYYVLNMLEESTIWGGVPCDGYCLLDEIGYLLEDAGIDPTILEEEEE
jgi:hypothetical protein